MIGLVILGPSSWLAANELRVASVKRAARLTTAQKNELSVLLDRRDTRARESIERWNMAATHAALAGLTFSTDACPLTLKPPSNPSAAAYVKFATHDEAFGAWSLCILRAGDDAPSCARAHATAPELLRMRARIADDDVYLWDLEQVKSLPPEVEPPATVIVVDSEVRSSVHSPAVGRVSFVPGTLSGRLFLFAPEQGRFVCAGDVTVRNSKNVDIEYSHFGQSAAGQQSQAEYETRNALERDLELHLRFAAPAALRKLQAR